MKRITFTFVIFLTFFLVACGAGMDNNSAESDNNNATTENERKNNNADDANSDDTSNNTSDHANESANEATKDNDADRDMRQQMEELPFTKFEIGIEYSGDIEYEAEIKLRNNQVEAELENEIEGVYMKGPEAFDIIFPIVKELNIEKDTEKSEVINSTLDAFGLDHDYVEYELEIEYDDGTKVEFEDG